MTTTLLLFAPFLLAGCLDHTHDLGDPVATTDVAIGGPWLFEPAWAVVAPNSTVHWNNDGDAYHTVTIRSLGFDAVIKPGASASYTFTQPGTYDYVCEYHQPQMSGRITVAPQASPSPGNATTNATAP